MEIGKLFLGVLLTFIVVVLLPFLLARFALIPELNGAAWYILLVTAGGLSLKTLFADLRATSCNGRRSETTTARSPLVGF